MVFITFCCMISTHWNGGLIMKKLGFGTMGLPLYNFEDKTSINQELLIRWLIIS